MIEVQHKLIGRTLLLRDGGISFACKVLAARRITSVYNTLEFKVAPVVGTGEAWIKADMLEETGHRFMLKRAPLRLDMIAILLTPAGAEVLLGALEKVTGANAKEMEVIENVVSQTLRELEHHNVKTD